MSAIMRVRGEVRASETGTKDGKVWGRKVTVLTEGAGRLGDGVTVVIFDRDSGVPADPRSSVDWFVRVEPSRFGINVTYLSAADSVASSEVAF